MAVYYQIDNGRPIQNGGAVGLAPQAKSTQGFVVQGPVENVSHTSAYEGLLDGRFKVGGATGWERPGSNLP
jgi:hypothetical protein